MAGASRIVQVVVLFICIRAIWFVGGIEPMETLQDLIKVGDQYYGSGTGSGGESLNESSD